jgi:hypothetical protein
LAVRSSMNGTVSRRRSSSRSAGPTTSVEYWYCTSTLPVRTRYGGVRAVQCAHCWDFAFYTVVLLCCRTQLNLLAAGNIFQVLPLSPTVEDVVRDGSFQTTLSLHKRDAWESN